MFTTKKDLSCNVAFAIKYLTCNSESCLTLCKCNATLLGFRRIQIPLECEEACKKIYILLPHSANYTFSSSDDDEYVSWRQKIVAFCVFK